MRHGLPSEDVSRGHLALSVDGSDHAGRRAEPRYLERELAVGPDVSGLREDARVVSAVEGQRGQRVGRALDFAAIDCVLPAGGGPYAQVVRLRAGGGAPLEDLAAQTAIGVSSHGELGCPGGRLRRPVANDERQLRGERALRTVVRVGLHGKVVGPPGDQTVQLHAGGPAGVDLVAVRLRLVTVLDDVPGNVGFVVGVPGKRDAGGKGGRRHQRDERCRGQDNVAETTKFHQCTLLNQ